MHTSAIILLLACSIPVQAADWTWSWPAGAGDAPVAASVTTFKYGKDWAYAVEIDDGPKWVRTFAIPFFATYHFTDAPPGVAGGRKLPFVGSVAAIVSGIGYNETNVDWNDLKALVDAGWGVMNHSFDHRGRSWGEGGKLSDEEIAVDACWSQAILASGAGGRLPTGAVYANGYTDYNRHDALAKAGIVIATRVGGSSTRDVTDPAVKWLDFPRNYLDEGVWSGSGKGDPMAQFPGAVAAGPPAKSLIIDFTHGIEQQPAHVNHQRWLSRLQTIERNWGAGGSDALWCAPTAEVADYVHAAEAATVRVAGGRLTVSLPDAVPGSALTLRITGISASAAVKPPAGGALYRQGDAVVLTTPCIGRPGGRSTLPRLVSVYDGPAKDVRFDKPVEVAGVTLGVRGSPKAAETYRVSLRTALGDRQIGERELTAGKWVVGSQLCAVMPQAQPILATGVVLQSVPELQHLVVWGVDRAGADR